MNKIILIGGLFVLGIASLTASAANIKNGESVAFLGDSIMKHAHGETGYVRICEAAFKTNGLDVAVVPAGDWGASHLAMERFEKVVLPEKPTHLVVGFGINDVNDGARGVKLPQYKENISKIVERAQAASMKVILLTPTMFYENVKHPHNNTLAPYVEYLRELAKEKGCVLVDVNVAQQEFEKEFREKKEGKGYYWTEDGIHLDIVGHLTVARLILKDGFGFTDAELAKSDEAYKNIVFKKHLRFRLELPMTGEEYLRFVEDARNAKCGPTEYIKSQVKPAVDQVADKLYGAKQ